MVVSHRQLYLLQNTSLQLLSYLSLLYCYFVYRLWVELRPDLWRNTQCVAAWQQTPHCQQHSRPGGTPLVFVYLSDRCSLISSSNACQLCDQNLGQCFMDNYPSTDSTSFNLVGNVGRGIPSALEFKWRRHMRKDHKLKLKAKETRSYRATMTLFGLHKWMESLMYFSWSTMFPLHPDHQTLALPRKWTLMLL